MHCTNCGTSLPEDIKFCSSCGTQVDGESHDSKTGKKSEDKGNEMGGGALLVAIAVGGWWLWSTVNAGIDVEVSYCEHKIENCTWDENLPTAAHCTFTNTAAVPIRQLTYLRTWSYSSDGVLLRNALAGSGSVSPGRSVQIDLYFDRDTHHAYVCGLDPEDGVVGEAMSTLLKPLPIS